MLNSVLEVPRNVGKELGVWGKPEGIARPIMEWLCVGGDRVWDGFAGSGTFGVVADELGLKYEGYEIDPENCRKANERISRAKSNLSLYK